MKKVKLDKYKEEIVEYYDTSRGNIFIPAAPGSGKSFMLKLLSKRTPLIKSQIYLAFNKSIVKEIQGGLRDNVEVSTIHSKAYSILLKNLNLNIYVDKEGTKNFILGKKLLKFDFIQLNYEESKSKTPEQKKIKLQKKRDKYLFDLSYLIDLCKLNLVPLEKQVIDKIADDYGVEVYSHSAQQVIDILTYCLNEDLNTSYKKPITFTDMLWLTYHRVPEDLFPKYAVVLIDEAQDLNPLQTELVLRLKHKRGRFVAVGDEKQSIYSFQGSNLNSFNKLRELPKTKTLPLSVTYRCPRLIVAEANKVFEGDDNFIPVEAHPDAELGAVRKGDFTEAEDGDFILCRNNSPLVTAMLELMKVGKKANIIGKDFGEALLRLLSVTDNVSELRSLLDKKLTELRQKGVNKPAMDTSYGLLKEKVEIIESLTANYGNLSNVSRAIKTIFVENSSNGITLSTIHKSKGLEAERVFFLDKHLIPSKYARTDLDYYQEKCLEFVAVTRAKQELIYCKSE